MKWTNGLGRWLFVGGAWTATALSLGAAGAGCLARPVGQQPPTTKVNFTSTVSQQAVDKVDILFAIDNSASMGDKQEILKDAVPNLLQGLLRPRCVDTDGKPDPAKKLAEPTGTKENHYGCPAGYDPEFNPVTDMHIGIVSSSLGNFGGDVCAASNPRTNDKGHLVNVKPGGGPVALAQPSNFLAWFPQSKDNEDPKRHPAPENPVRTIDDLTANFQDLVVGIGQEGCGLEAQLESVYRFLIQPDPWDSITVTPQLQADLGDSYDVTVLQQRADFLRPDSLVAIIMLTDEDDSSADPLSINGSGWAFMNQNFPGSSVPRASGAGKTAPRGTSACATDPGSKDCTSCGLRCVETDPDCQKVKQDPNCKTSGIAGKSGAGFDGFYGPTDDELNVRFQNMKRRYGLDPQYPVQRYIDGLTKVKVPDRKAEHVIKDGVIAAYTSTPKCTNPLFASKLPRNSGDQLCTLPIGTRSPDLVFFAVVGGVPNQLLYPNGYDAENLEKNAMTSEKWVKILGKDPIHYDTTGIDSHMIQSIEPRTGLKGADKARGEGNDDDPYNGREWNTEKQDLQYACTFKLPQTRSCASGGASCDCASDSKGNPPLCGPNNTQVKAKAYPTVREFEVVHALGDQGVIASLCPIQLDNADAPDYGYKPAVAAIIDRLKNALTVQCLPQRLREANANPDPVPCLVLAQLSADSSGTCADVGLEVPEKEILDVFLEQQRAASGNVGDGGVDLTARPVCKLPQVAVARGESCKDNTDLAWCYVENDPSTKKNPAGRCPQALIFSSATSKLAGASFKLQCIQQFSADQTSTQ